MPVTASHAYVTLVMLGDKYVPGALALGWSLRRFRSNQTDLVVLITQDVSQQARGALAEVFDFVQLVDFIQARTLRNQGRRFQHMYQWEDMSFTKFQALSLTQYEKVLLLDADMVAVASPEELFSIRAPAGMCSAVKGPAEQLQWHSRILPAEMVARSVARGYGIKGCLYLVEPSAHDLQALKDTLAATPAYGNSREYCGPDERLISEYYAFGRDAKHAVPSSSPLDAPQGWTHIHEIVGFPIDCRE
ncbi:hypothetical protein WJX72_006216 [[Myrmecia] bisecta]|uniref:Hexosyltransferase n=1 Tax=[Myrmecia] bisecta TaxID=41462 RepID=A0AAW1PAE9_9CHLO